MRCDDHEAAVGIFGREYHTLRLDAFELAGGEVGDEAHLFAHEFLGTVMLGDAEQLRTDYMLTEQDKIVDERELFQCENLTVRIRYRSRPLPCRVKRLADGRLLVRFLETASAIAPGQSAVFYDGRRVLGGAFIASQRGIGLVILENEGF